MSRNSRDRGGGGGGLLKHGGRGEVGGADRESHLDGLNLSMTEGLASKLSQLKGLAMGLEGEAKDHIPLLDGMDDDLEMGGIRMGGSSNRLRGMGRTRGVSGRRLSCYVGIAVTAFLFLIYYFLLLPLTSNT